MRGERREQEREREQKREQEQKQEQEREQKQKQEREQGQGQESGGRPPGKIRVPKRLLAFIGILLLECAAAVVLLLLLAYVCFRMRFSAEVVRAGITAIYLLPCVLGGRVARRAGFRPAMLWGVGAGLAYFGLLFALAPLVPGTGTGTDIAVGVPLLCALGGAAGALPGKKRTVGKYS